MKYNIIGAGRLGTHLAFALKTIEDIELLAICNQSMASSNQAIQYIGQGQAINHLHDLPAADLIFLTTKDDQLPLLASELLNTSSIKKGTIMIHCSGALPSTVLLPLKSKGCLIASVHPLKAFKMGEPEPEAFKDVDCIIEGDAEALPILCHLFKRLGARIHQLQAKQKASYHAAAVFASNYLVTLADKAVMLMEEAGINQEDAYPMITSLMQSSLNHLKATNSSRMALTGPLSRGDSNTIKRHINAIKDPLTSELYIAAAQATLPLTHLNEQKKKELLSLLKHKDQLEYDRA